MRANRKVGPAATGPNRRSIERHNRSQSCQYTTDNKSGTRKNTDPFAPSDGHDHQMRTLFTATPALSELYKLIVYLEGLLVATILRSEIPVLEYLPAELKFINPMHRELISLIREVDPTGANADLMSVYDKIGESQMINAVVLSGIHSSGRVFPACGFIQDFCTALILMQELLERALGVAEEVESVLHWGVYYAY